MGIISACRADEASSSLAQRAYACKVLKVARFTEDEEDFARFEMQALNNYWQVAHRQLSVRLLTEKMWVQFPPCQLNL